MPSSPQFSSQSISHYARPIYKSAVVQLLDTLIPYTVIWVMIVMLVRWEYPLWMALLLMIANAGFLVRIFIIFHDCCHGSFFASRRANTVLGYITGVLTFTPFEQWRRSHSRHHDTVGDLDRRGTGDVWTMTVEEYQASTKIKRLTYRLLRNPVLMVGFGPAILFLIVQRFFSKQDRKGERTSVIVTDLAIAAVIAIAAFTIGIRTYLLIQLPVSLMAGAAGIWLFYVQHQFEGVYWARHDEWEPMRAALEGSSYLKLPRILQWFTGSIGLHHIHHIQQRIPNYSLQQCYDDTPALQRSNPITLLGTLRCLNLNLWDERRKRLVSFRSVATA